MKHVRIVLLVIVCLSGVGYFVSIIGQGTKSVDWNDELRKAQTEIEKNPKSSFWHNQAGVAFDALGDFINAEKELVLASKLDSTNPITYYSLYAFYQRKGTLAQQRKVLLNALENDSSNPLGHFQLAVTLEKEGYMQESLKEYRLAKSLVSGVEGSEYIDGRRNPYEIEVVRTDVDNCIRRVAKLKGSKEHKN